jgi:hypothetical protein
MVKVRACAVLILSALLAVSCAGVRHEAPAAPVLRESRDEVDLRSALVLLSRGELSESQVILERLARQGEPPDLRARAYFYHGIAKLQGMEGADGLMELKAYFDRYPWLFPDGPYLENTRAISQLLGNFLSEVAKSQERIDSLSSQAKEQERLITDLQDKIQKFEQIQIEAEKKRQSL